MSRRLHRERGASNPRLIYERERERIEGRKKKKEEKRSIRRETETRLATPGTKRLFTRNHSSSPFLTVERWCAPGLILADKTPPECVHCSPTVSGKIWYRSFVNIRNISRDRDDRPSTGYDPRYSTRYSQSVLDPGKERVEDVEFDGLA